VLQKWQHDISLIAVINECTGLDSKFLCDIFGRKGGHMTRQDNPEIFTQPVELVRLDGTTAVSGAKPIRPILDFARRHAPIGLMVVLPTIMAVIYFGLVASARYETEAKFVVRGPSAAATSQIASLVQGSSVVRSADDAYVVDEYIVSRDAMKQLVVTDGLLDVFSRPEVDFLSRYPGFFMASNEERLFQHYLKFVSTSFDQTTGISTLKVQAFRPEDAQRIANALLRASEKIVNKLNERSQRDAIGSATREVEESKRRALAGLERVTDFRNRESVLDPGRMSASVLDTVSRLSLEQALTNAKLAELLKSSAQNPQIPSLRLRITALDDQINNERLQLAGGDASMAPRIAEYERLMLEREFAERTFVSALNALEAAQVNVLRQRLYLERISSPAVPDYAAYPYRLAYILGVFVLCGMMYRIFRVLVLDTLAHATR
jgi:capsular polysaccharide transport system permease protein